MHNLKQKLCFCSFLRYGEKVKLWCSTAFSPDQQSTNIDWLSRSEMCFKSKHLWLENVLSQTRGHAVKIVLKLKLKLSAHKPIIYPHLRCTAQVVPAWPPQLMWVCTRSPGTSPTLDWVTGSRFIKQKPLLKGGSQDREDTTTQSIGTLLHPLEIICDFTCADTLALIQVCLFSPLICRISGFAVWIFPQCRSKVAAFLFLFYISF